MSFNRGFVRSKIQISKHFIEDLEVLLRLMLKTVIFE